MFIKKTLVIMFVLSLILISSVNFESINAFTDDFSTDDNWVSSDEFIAIDYDTEQILIDSCARNTNSIIYHEIDAIGVREFNTNISLNISAIDTAKSRINIGLYSSIPYNTELATWGAINRFFVMVTGYMGGTTFDLYYNATLIGTHALTTDTLYNISLSYYQNPGNNTYYGLIKIWTSSGSWLSPDIISSTKWFNTFTPKLMSYFVIHNHNTNEADGIISATLDDYSDDVSQETIPLIPILDLTPNPIFVGKNSESSMIMDGEQLDVWFTTGDTLGVGTYDNLWYSYANNDTLTNYATPVKVIEDIRFPTVVLDENSGIYYCFAHKMSDITGDMFVWTSTDKINWTIGNSGNAVLTPSTNVNSQWYTIWNPGIVLIDGVFHGWFEIATSAGTLNQNGVRLGYAYTTIAEMNFNLHLTENNIIDKGGNPWIQYVPERNGLIVMYGLLSDKWQIRASVVSLDNDLTQPSSYYGTYNWILGPDNEQTADPSLTYAPTKTNPIVIQFFHNQPIDSDLYQVYSNLTLNQLYDAMANGTLAIPTGLSVVQILDNVFVDWNTYSNAISYNLYRSTNNIDFTLIENTNISEYSDINVLAETTYYYKVNVVTLEGVSDNSSTVSIHVNALPEPFEPSDYLKIGKVLIVLAGAIPFIGFIIWALGKKD